MCSYIINWDKLFLFLVSIITDYPILLFLFSIVTDYPIVLYTNNKPIKIQQLISAGLSVGYLNEFVFAMFPRSHNSEVKHLKSPNILQL